MILVNGKPASSVPATDRGFQYGDGLFETLAVIHGHALCLDAHLGRLASGCRALEITAVPEDQLRSDLATVTRGVARGVVKIIVTRGTSARGYRASATATPTRVVSSHPWPPFPSENHSAGIALRVCRTRMSSNPRLAGLKHLNRLEQVLAVNEIDDPKFSEGLMLDTDGIVVEGTMSNIFFVRDGRLHTPELSRCGVHGIIRAEVLEWARDNIDQPVEFCRAVVDELFDVEECFICNSLIGVWPVREIEGKSIPLGALTRTVQSDLAAKNIIAEP
ncbi:MAG: aminodeoxychorismate lyase [Gammaproteobacteria bacterium]|nr:aminodeoxychorismate lyase [Gammaproteobacteria bacterium]